MLLRMCIVLRFHVAGRPWGTIMFFFFLPFKVLSQRLELERDDELVPEKNS